MMDVLNSPWVIGIGGGVLSGLVVTLITRYLFSRRDNREYMQRVVTANQEILYAVRPGISEGIIPSHEVVSSLLNATATKYGVDPNDLYDTSTLVDVLTKEVMDSSFLAASAKADFCNQLAQLRPHVEMAKADAETVADVRRATPELAQYRQRMVSMMSAMLGVMAAVMTVSVALFGILKDSSFDLHSKNIAIVLPTVLTILVALAMSYLTWVVRIVERKIRERSRKSLEESEDSKTTRHAQQSHATDADKPRR